VGKNKSTVAKEILTEIPKYRWEFLRRNKNYIRECSSGKKHKSKYWQKKYQIEFPYDPSIPFSSLKPKSVDKFMLHADVKPLPSVMLKHLGIDRVNSKDFDRHDVVEQLLLEDPELPRNAVKLNIVVDITRRKEIIFEEFSQIISWLHKKVPSQTRFNEYDRYLKVYDLHKQGKNYREIAKAVYPKLCPKKTKDHVLNKYDWDPIIEKVKKNLKACQALIDGGYQKIRKDITKELQKSREVGTI
jgi:hypothetical protein